MSPFWRTTTSFNTTNTHKRWICSIWKIQLYDYNRDGGAVSKESESEFCPGTADSSHSPKTCAWGRLEADTTRSSTDHQTMDSSYDCSEGFSTEFLISDVWLFQEVLRNLATALEDALTSSQPVFPQVEVFDQRRKRATPFGTINTNVFFFLYFLQPSEDLCSQSVSSQSLCRPLSLITQREQCEQQTLFLQHTKAALSGTPPLPCCCKESFSRVTMSAGVFLSRRRRSAADHFTFDATVTAASRGRQGWGGGSEEF